MHSIDNEKVEPHGNDRVITPVPNGTEQKGGKIVSNGDLTLTVEFGQAYTLTMQCVDLYGYSTLTTCLQLANADLLAAYKQVRAVYPIRLFSGDEEAPDVVGKELETTLEAQQSGQELNDLAREVTRARYLASMINTRLAMSRIRARSNLDNQEKKG